MTRNKILNLLGIAQRAGKITTGDALYQDLKNGQVFLLFLASDLSDKQKQRIKDKSIFYKIESIENFSSKELSKAIGLKNRKIVGVKDMGFANTLITYRKKEVTE